MAQISSSASIADKAVYKTGTETRRTAANSFYTPSESHMVSDIVSGVCRHQLHLAA
jgi:hypothetical protein